MAKFSKDKGSRGERELFAILSDELGITLRRNLEQWRSGGADNDEIPGIVIEVKRQESLSVKTWWTQAVRQAHGRGIPVLAYRANNKPWRIRMPMYVFVPSFADGSWCQDLEYTIEISVACFCAWARESIPFDFAEV